MPDSPAKKVFIVSACLMGLCTRYDSTTKANLQAKAFLKDSILIPVCPEQLGGMPTPRSAADIIGGNGHDALLGKARVCTIDGDDVTSSFVKGAKQVLQIAQHNDTAGVCLKARSPSCAVSGTIGVTAALLAEHDYPLFEF